MRLTFVVPSLTGGGAEFVTQSWAQELRSRGHNITILLTGFTTREPKIPGVTITHLCPAGVGRLREIRSLRSALRDAPDTLVISMMTRANISTLLALPRRDRNRVITSERNMPMREHDASGVHLFMRRRLVTALYRRARGLIAVSHGVGAAYYALADLNIERVVMVPNPSLTKSGISRLARVDPEDETIRLVVPARLVEKKRPGLAFEIAELLHKDGIKVELHFFGDGPLRGGISQRVAPYNVMVHGFQADWYDRMPDNAVVLLPSKVEGLPNVLIEAASRGVPSVVGGTTFAIDAIVDGVTGIMVHVDTPAAYADGVRRAAALKRTISTEWLQQFTPQRSADALEETIQYLSGAANQNGE